MRAEYINPFVNSVYNTMETMLGIKPVRLDIEITDESSIKGDVSGIIGFADKKIFGVVALSFPEKTVLSIYQKMMGERVARINAEVQDIVGELANIVAGGAKKELSHMGFSFHISIPTVVVGKSHKLGHRFGTPLVVVPFKLNKDIFTMEVGMKTKE